jgi:carboxymethylenebutenolidase
MYTTDMYEGVLAETVSIQSHNGDHINAYMARPLGDGPFPGIALIHHAPGWDDWYKETTLKYARHGYVAICPDLYQRVGQGVPADIGAQVRAEGGIADAQVVGDMEGAIRHLRSLPYLNGKVGVFGTCSGGRHTFLVACTSKERVDAAVDCWGGRVVMAPDALNEKYPVAPIDLTKDLQSPLLGIFGEDDQGPSPEQVAMHEEELKKQGKNYEFHMYPGAGHGFFYYDRPAYRQEQAMDGWSKVWDFLGKHLDSTS